MEDVLIVGAGRMAQSHALAAVELGWTATAVTRSEATAAAFRTATGLSAETTDDLDTWLARRQAPARAIVAVNVEALAGAATSLIRAGVTRILLEKPGGVDAAELLVLSREAEARGADVRLAYNRRFYAATGYIRDRLAEDGGATSVRFDFTELADAVGRSPQSDSVKAAWLLANSTHVIDLAFHLAGEPETLSASVAGGLDWHPAAVFTGSGRTAGGALYSYHADWTAPGRWSVDVRSRERRFVMEPMETVRVQARGSFELVSPAIDDANDKRHKPGVLLQLRAFLTGDGVEALVDLPTQARRAQRLYSAILSGTNGRLEL